VAKFELVFNESVPKDLKDTPNQGVRQIIEITNLLRDAPHPAGNVKLSGKDYYRIRQGNYRLIYEIKDSQLFIIVIKVGHRREVYS